MLLDAAKLGGWSAYHTYDSRRSQAGFPDLILIRGEELLALELKSDTGRVSFVQRGWLRSFQAVKTVDAFVVRPDTADEVMSRLTRRP